jgi:hypothetical protein
MKNRITRRRVVWLGLLPLAAAVTFVFASASNAAPKDHSRPLHGHMRNIVQHFGCPDAPVTGVCSTFDADGSINGDGFVVVDTFPSFDPKALGFSEAHTVITTRKGELHRHEAALFDLLVNADHPFVDLCVIDGAESTGDYKDASGYIQEVGTFPGTVGSLEYFGRITLQRD